MQLSDRNSNTVQSGGQIEIVHHRIGAGASARRTLRIWWMYRCDPGCMVVNGYSNKSSMKTHDPNWATLGHQLRDNAEDDREMLRRRNHVCHHRSRRAF